MTSSHTLASITADLISNGIPRHFREEAQFPNRLCWFLDDRKINERWIFLFNPGSLTPTAAIIWHFIPSPNGWEFDPCCDGWSLDFSRLDHEETPDGLTHEGTIDYDHTTIRHAVVLITFIDQYNAKHHQSRLTQLIQHCK